MRLSSARLNRRYEKIRSILQSLSSSFLLNGLPIDDPLVRYTIYENQPGVAWDFSIVFSQPHRLVVSGYLHNDSPLFDKVEVCLSLDVLNTSVLGVVPKHSEIGTDSNFRHIEF